MKIKLKNDLSFKYVFYRIKSFFRRSLILFFDNHVINILITSFILVKVKSIFTIAVTIFIVNFI